MKGKGMADYKMIEVEETSYLYNERSCSMDPSDISQNMGVAFQNVLDFITKNDIVAVGKPLSVYYTYDETVMTFQAGFLVSAEDASKAEGEVKTGVLPAGKVLNFIHRGPYAKLRVSYGEMMRYLEEKGLAVGVPTWEVYLNEPDKVPEEKLETDIYVTLAAT
jgi:effector-binding domain-containing protein